MSTERPLRARLHIGVIGGAECDEQTARIAEEVGRLVAREGAVLVCGGMRGVMEAACRGAKEAGGTTIGILPGADRSQGNDYLDVAVATGFGEARNLAIIKTADAIIALPGSYGTLSEIGFALRMGKRVIGLDTWDIEGVVRAETAEEAVRLALGQD